MIRRGSIVVPTAPYVVHHPWQVEWIKGTELRCFTGILADSAMIANEQYEPTRFPQNSAMSMSVTTQGISARRLTQGRVRMSSLPFPTGAKTGSVVIRLNRDGFGRTDQTNAEPLDEQKGYASWQESEIIGSGSADSVYLVLHKSGSFWYLSWIAQADLEDSDIRIAVIKKRTGRGIKDWTLLQLWKSDFSDRKDETPFLVTHSHKNAFKINSGYCTYYQLDTNLNVDSEGEMQGTSDYIRYAPDTMSTYTGTVKIEKPTVWYQSTPKDEPFPPTPAPVDPNAPPPTPPPTPPQEPEQNPSPTLDGDYFVCDSAVSSSWSVILGHPVPSHMAPSLYIVPREFARVNLMVDVAVPGYGIYVQAPTETKTYGQEDLGEPQTILQYNLVSEQVEIPGSQPPEYYTTYHLETYEQQIWPQQHEHTLYFPKFESMDAFWTMVCFRGIVVAHMDWSSTDEKWTVKQFHSGNATIPNSTPILNYQYVQQNAETTFQDYVAERYNINDHFWTTSYGISSNITGAVEDANLMWQDAGHMGNSINARLIKY